MEEVDEGGAARNDRSSSIISHVGEGVIGGAGHQPQT